MNQWKWPFAVWIAAGVLASGAAAQKPSPNAVIQALEAESQRAMKILATNDPAPYFVGYQVNDISTVSVDAEGGALQSTNEEHQRLLDVEVRVGDYVLDNTHQVRGAGGGSSRAGSMLMPLDDDVDALRSVIWLETDRRYKASVEQLIRVKTNRATRVDEEDVSGDFTVEPGRTASMSVAPVRPKISEWETRARAYSALFRQYPEILEGTAGFSSQVVQRYVVNSEGTSVQSGVTLLRLSLYARVRAEDGMELYRFESFDAHSLDGLPDDKTVTKTIEKMISDLRALRAAPVIEPFTGPAILSGRASGVFFHEIFGHRIEGSRQKSENDGQTFTKQINQPVLPDFLSVVDDPTTERIGDTELNGYYRYDDEGVAAQRVTVVENGVLKNFLMSRAPVAGFMQSNGHGRKEPGYRSVGRQGNLIVQASRTVNDATLRQMLIEEAKRQGKTYGLLFDDISGGFTLTDRSSPQAFQVTPIMVYRVYVDGRPDELVRGADLIGTPLTSFSKIVAASDKVDIFNGFCGAESGYVPVSAVSPSILTTQIEVQKKAKSSDLQPILPPPPAQPGASS
ncbi:MAG TPA: TldD/PmbA family protein [Terriglobia bacterium]|nr:TldD/PmbA family protein [Terriglobia bacterium]